MFLKSVTFLCIALFLHLPSYAKGNPLTECLFRLNSETLCYGTLGCKTMCNAKPGVDCRTYCVGLNTEKRNFVVEECVPLNGLSPKSVCKCRDTNNNRPKGLYQLACNGLYMGQLIKRAIKATIL